MTISPLPHAKTRSRRSQPSKKKVEPKKVVKGEIPTRKKEPEETPTNVGVSDAEKSDEAIDLVLDTAEGLFAERGERVWGSMIKQTLKRRRPGFTESNYGFRSFSDLLEEAKQRGLVDLELDERSGGYVIVAIHRGRMILARARTRLRALDAWAWGASKFKPGRVHPSARNATRKM